MSKSNITLPPRKKEGENEAAEEKKISEIINKGGSPIGSEDSSGDGSSKETFKQINVKLLESELESINILRDKRPKPRGKRIGIAIHDWIIEAINEKIQRDLKKYKE